MSLGGKKSQPHVGGAGGNMQQEQNTRQISKANGAVHIPVLVLIPNAQVVAMLVSLGILTRLGTERSRQHQQYADHVTWCIGSCA